jgi:hypothetical protein
MLRAILNLGLLAAPQRDPGVSGIQITPHRAESNSPQSRCVLKKLSVHLAPFGEGFLHHIFQYPLDRRPHLCADIFDAFDPF